MPKKHKSPGNSKKEQETENTFFYVNEAAKDYDYADFVQVSSYPHGVILNFGKWYPDEQKHGLFQGILLPFNVAEALKSIIEDHVQELVDKGLVIKKKIKLDDNE